MIVEEFDLQQVTSSILMVASLAFVLSAVVTMRRKGRTGYERKDPTLFAFERTTVLVDSGIFQFVRHPMYSSLLLLAWGIMMRRIEIDLFLVACAATISGVMAACIEERENLSYFGEPYKRYAATSRIK
jgi:protein-S-isoprenylcysteine O-methyltransferase Ste14